VLANLLKYAETPILEIKWKSAEKSGVRLLIKREDLNHEFISGNKWWKLKYNVEEAVRQNKKTLLTFGGAFSNHIYATAASAYELGLKSIGVIRGEETFPLNGTLSFAKSQGMRLRYVSREEYRKKDDRDFLEAQQKLFGDFYLIPEGGTNEFAVKGCAELGLKLLSEISFDYLCLPVGTGGTMAGIIAGLEGQKEIIGISVLKNGEFLKDEIEKFLQLNSSPFYGNWRLLTGYHHGGYAKTTKELMDFIGEMKSEHNLPLDHVYTGKLFWALNEEIKKGFFPRGSTILALHTGGIQGANLNF
jgi:1-aminocyclopropane-1-carboxylate deaminase